MTGATSGIGLAAAEALAARGIADLASNSAGRRAAKEILGRYDRIEALVNNARVYLPTRTLGRRRTPRPRAGFARSASNRQGSELL